MKLSQTFLLLHPQQRELDVSWRGRVRRHAGSHVDHAHRGIRRVHGGHGKGCARHGDLHGWAVTRVLPEAVLLLTEEAPRCDEHDDGECRSRRHNERDVVNSLKMSTTTLTSVLHHRWWRLVVGPGVAHVDSCVVEELLVEECSWVVWPECVAEFAGLHSFMPYR